MKVLVTGSAGFIGQALMRRLADAGFAVAGLDKDPSATSHYVCNLLDAATLKKIVGNLEPDALVHLAARTDLDERTDLAGGYAANIDGVRNLIDVVRATPSIKRAIWTSSQLVCRVGYVPRDETDYNADTLYGKSKIITEQIVREQDGGGREWCLVRPTTVWGPGMSAHYQLFLRMVQGGYYVHVGREPLWKSYSYIENITFQYMRLLQAPAELIHRKTFYLADYEPIDLQAWCDAFQRAFEVRPIRHVPFGLARALGQVRRRRERGRHPQLSVQFVPPQQRVDAVSLRHGGDRGGLRTPALHDGARRRRNRGLASQNIGALGARGAPQPASPRLAPDRQDPQPARQ